MRKYDVAVIGVTRLVGEALLTLLAEREFPVNRGYAVDTAQEAGGRVEFKGTYLPVQDLESFDFTKVQFAFFCVAAAVAREFVPKAVAAGCVVIDTGAEFRAQDDIPLVVAEVNPQAIALYKPRRIIASPSCSAIQMAVALNPIHRTVGIDRINVCTYQAVSDGGKEAVEELARQTANLLNARPTETHAFPCQIAFNVVPQTDAFMDNGYTCEEWELVWDLRKVLGDENLQVNPTAVRVPVFFGNSLAIHIETRERIAAHQARDMLIEAPGVELVDEPVAGGYPTAVTHGAGNDRVFVGRIREDHSHPRGLDLWVVADNVRKGAALNGVQIAEVFIKEFSP